MIYPHGYCTNLINTIWTASSEFGTYRLCEQRRFRRACASAQSRQNLRCSLIQAVNQEELPDRKPDPWPLWMAGHAQLKFVMTECSKTQICLTGLICKKWKGDWVAGISYKLIIIWISGAILWKLQVENKLTTYLITVIKLNYMKSPEPYDALVW